MPVNEKFKQDAIKALDGMRQIVRHEMLTTGSYREADISNFRLAKQGAICGGHKHCAVGSLWIGAGVKLIPNRVGSSSLPGISTYVRDDFLRRRPALRLAYDSLNLASERFAEKHGIELPNEYEGAMEDLFEAEYDGGDLTKRDLLGIIASAKRLIKKA